MTSAAFAITGTRPAAGRHAGPRHAQDWLSAGRRAQGRHARPAPDQHTPDQHPPGQHALDQHTGGRRASAFARRFAVSVAAAAMAAIGVPEVG
jgi:hypothetical protein